MIRCNMGIKDLCQPSVLEETKNKQYGRENGGVGNVEGKMQHVSGSQQSEGIIS